MMIVMSARRGRVRDVAVESSGLLRTCVVLLVCC